MLASASSSSSQLLPQPQHKQQHPQHVLSLLMQETIPLAMSLKPMIRVLFYLSTIIVLSQFVLLIEYHHESRFLLPRHVDKSFATYLRSSTNSNSNLGLGENFQSVETTSNGAMTEQEPLRSNHAYAFVMAGVDPQRPQGFRGILFSILVAAQILETSGSKADIVVLVQMAHDAPTDKVPRPDLVLLRNYTNINIVYLPKPIRAPTFYEAQFDKFRVLELTQYSRVLYLDADVMPLCNLDYLFHLSEKGVLKDNMVLAGNNEPANGGFMMLRPGEGEYQQLVDVMRQRDGRILVTPDLSFDVELGWGHVIRPPDYWRTRYNRQSGNFWNFTTAYGNQGLMYYWAKYVKQSASLFIGNEVENWVSDLNSVDGSPRLEGTLVDALKGHECPARMQFPYDRDTKPPYDMEGQIWHFDGKFAKPWMQSNLTEVLLGNDTSYRPYQMWFQYLYQVKQRVNIRLDVEKDLRHNPALGSWTTEEDFTRSMQRKYAYAFVMAGVDPENPKGYSGILFSILVVAQILKNSQSTADIVILVQMAWDTEWEDLPVGDGAYLSAYRSIVIKYLPKPAHAPSFYQAQFDKFRVLELTQYRRILYLDADVMPLCNLDYLFYLSERGIFKDNMVLAGNNEPSNGGFMMLRPGVGEYQQLIDIIDQRDGRILATPNLTFDEELGWGHVIRPPDYWRTRYNRQSGTFWNFTTAYGNQGLMYYWAKYVKQSASLFVGNEVENWVVDPHSSDGSPRLEGTLVDALKGHECRNRLLFPYDRDTIPPYDMEGQIWNFDGKFSKPWMQNNLTEILEGNKTSDHPYQMWFQVLDQVKQRLNITLNVDEELRADPALGSWTTADDLERSMRKKHAYAFVLPGVDPKHPHWYRGILFGILVVAEILESSGSTADVVIMVQMASGSKRNVLSKIDLAYLRAFSNIVVHYLPKPKYSPSVHQLQLNKFRILELTQYRRVLYLGADVMPLCNLDYLFYMSERGELKENAVVAGNNEPATAAFMMLRPGVNEFQQLQTVLAQRNSSLLTTSNPSVDEVSGWGYVIEEPDQWRTRYNRREGTRWDFSSALEDQGLLYHWVKYVKKNVSLFIGNEVENWSSNGVDATNPVLESTVADIIKGNDCPGRTQFPHDRHTKPPYDLEGQMWHFWSEKPWMLSNLDEIAMLTTKSAENLPFQLWFHMLDRVKLRVSLQPDLVKEE